MKNKRIGILMTAMALLGLVAACATTPETRIRKNPTLFQSFPAEAQAKIRQGGIALGFTPAMVRMALGDPSRVYTRTESNTVAEIWVYTDYSINYRPGAGQYYMPMIDRYGNVIAMPPPGVVSVEEQREYDRMRVEFRNNVVHGIEMAR